MVYLAIIIIAICFLMKDNIIKGNITAYGEKIYYTNDHRLFKKVKAERIFLTIKQAERAGYRAPKR